ncbi:MAG: glycosyl transferase [Planctomycetaceae bacterium]|nr:glycosyl transferase [Planctomycetaceae bacterium]
MTTPITVSLLIPTLDRSGAEKQLVELACGLPRDEFRTDVIALTRGGPLAQRLADHDIPLTVIGKRWRLDPLALSRLKRHLARSQPDILHTWLFAANAYGRLAHTATPATRVVVSERCVDSWKRPWQLWLDRRLTPRTDQLLANSHSVAAFYQSVGIPASLIDVIPNGIDTGAVPLCGETAGTIRDQLRQELDLAPETQLVTCVGRLAAQKRISDLLWAVELLHRRCPRVMLVVSGDGPERRRLERFAQQAGCGDRVRFLGHREDVAAIWAASDVAWLASSFEGQSNSLMEAMAAGLPVVASDIPANRELVTDEVTGHLVPLGDAAEFARRTASLLENPAVAQALGRAGRQRMQDDFSLAASINAHARLYRSLDSHRSTTDEAR